MDLYLTIAGTIGDVGEIPQEVSWYEDLTENAAKLTDIVCDRLYLMYSLSINELTGTFSVLSFIKLPNLSYQ